MKKILFGIFAVILSIGGVCADDIKELTLDTPVNWPISAFNRAIAIYCGRATRGEGVSSVSDIELGTFRTLFTYTSATREETFDRTVSDLEDSCGRFVLDYGHEYRQTSQISLRKILDMCMTTIENNGTCARIAQALVYYSMGQNNTVSVESDIADMIGVPQKLCSKGGDITDPEFCVNVQITYSGIDDSIQQEVENLRKKDNLTDEDIERYYAIRKYLVPQLIDNNIYVNNTAVGTCDIVPVNMSGEYGVAGKMCKMLNQYASWECFVLLAESSSGGDLRCLNKYIVYQESVRNNLSKSLYKIQTDLADIKKIENISGERKACFLRILEEQEMELRNKLSQFGDIVREYSYTRWLETKDMLNYSLSYDVWKATRECD